jgi:parallel beta-helix repeat protein
MNRRPLGPVLVLISLLILAPSATWEKAFALSLERNFTSSDSPPAGTRVILHQDFDNETIGVTPSHWNLTDKTSGSFLVEKTDRGKSAKFVDNSTEGSLGAYRKFAEQRGTVAVSFAVILVNNTGKNTGLEVRVDDGISAGANIVFGNGTIQYRDQNGQLITLRTSYVANRWYKIKFIMDIFDNLYNIHIDEHLEVMNAKFTGPCDQIHRIVINETSTSAGTQLPMGYIDDIEVRQGIVIPTDFPTIQEGIDKAGPGDVVIVSKNRTYFENVTIRKSVWLIGQDVGTTIIDGRFASAAPNRIAVLNCSNVTIYGFTISFSAVGGAQIYLNGSGNTITNNMILSGLGDGIHIVGSNNIVANNTVKSSMKCGIRVEGSSSKVIGNIIESSDECGIYICGSNSNIASNTVRSSLDMGIRVCGSNSTITNNKITSSVNIGIRVDGSNSTTIADNVILSSDQIGIHIANGNNTLVINNTIQENGVGLKCETNTNNSKIYQNRFVGNVQQAQDDGAANKWDDGYPYNPARKKGGGNYWSDYNGTDLYTGPNQNEHADCCLPSPDGIGDKPHNITCNGIDHYPLFLIQSVTQRPSTNKTDCNSRVTTGEIDYNTKVTVTAKTLNYVQVTKASIRAEYNGTKHGVIPMNISGNSLTATIPKQTYGTTVRYNVSALAYKANWLNSTSYPIPYPYLVLDWTPPNIDAITVNPNNPNENQTITVYTVVTEPLGASGVAKVFISYRVGNTSWTAEMTRLRPSSNNYTAVIPKQPGRSTLNFTITAVDNAGNWNTSDARRSKYIKHLAELSVVYGGKADEPCSIDLGAVSGDRTIDSKFTIKNLGDETLGWGIDVIKDGAWLKSVNPNSGSLLGGKSVNVTVTVDTNKCPDAGLYTVELSVKANGTVPQWAVIETFTVRYIVIDQSWASCEAPNRCDVGVTQYYAFHAKWAHNCSDAIGGKIILEGMAQGNSTDSTGWAHFSYSSQDPMGKTFRVGKVQFGNITAFRQKAPDRTTIWDRVYVNLSLARGWIDVGSMANVSWNDSYYEYDKSPFDGRPLFNPLPIHDTVGRYPINTSSIVDNKWHLTAFRSNTVWCIWDEIEIIGGGVSRSQLDVGQTGAVWFTAIYKYENKLFKGGDGTLYVNNETLIWSGDTEVWTKNYTYDTPGTRTFTVKRAEDRVHNLTKTKDNVGPLSITWGPIQIPWWQAWWSPSWGNPAKSQSSPVENQTTRSMGVESYLIWPLLIIILAGGIGTAITVVLFVKSGKKRPQGTNRE